VNHIGKLQISTKFFGKPEENMLLKLKKVASDFRVGFVDWIELVQGSPVVQGLLIHEIF
jgi:hypothetical protein